MSKIDQFESAFKSAERTPFLLETVRFRNCLTVTDMDSAGAEVLRQQVHEFIKHTTHEESNWECLTSDDLQSIEDFLRKIEKHQPDLICTYRNLMTPASQYPYSLGVYLDVMSQATSIPVLVVPNPATNDLSNLRDSVKRVMAITDHLAGEHHLVSMAAALTPDDGTLWLTHVEDEKYFNRFIHSIGKIPEIDTDEARELIMQQLLKDPSDYIQSCRAELVAAGAKFRVEPLTTIGHRLFDYKKIIKEHDVDLVVLNTKDDDQLAMHGLAYPLSVELRDTPLLLA